MEGLNVTDVRRNIIPLLWCTIKKREHLSKVSVCQQKNKATWKACTQWDQTDRQEMSQTRCDYNCICIPINTEASMPVSVKNVIFMTWWNISFGVLHFSSERICRVGDSSETLTVCLCTFLSPPLPPTPTPTPTAFCLCILVTSLSLSVHFTSPFVGPCVCVGLSLKRTSKSISRAPSSV